MRIDRTRERETEKEKKKKQQSILEKEIFSIMENLWRPLWIKP